MLEKSEKQDVNQMIDVGPLSEVIKRDGENALLMLQKLILPSLKRGLPRVNLVQMKRPYWLVK